MSLAKHGVGRALLMTRSFSKARKFLAHHFHEIGHCAQIPVGIARLHVPKICRQGNHSVVDIHAFPVPLENAPTHECVTQILNSRRCVVTSSNPPELLTETAERPLDCS